MIESRYDQGANECISQIVTAKDQKLETEVQGKNNEPVKLKKNQ